MLKKHLMKVVLFYFLIIPFSLLSKAQIDNNSSNSDKGTLIADSLFQAIQFCSDSACFDNCLTSIKKHRRDLKKDYLLLLYKLASQTEKQNYTKGSMKAFDLIGLQYRYDEIYDSAEVYHNRSLAIALILNDSAQLYYNYNNLGQVYRMQDLSVQALFYFLKALKITEAIGDLKASSRTMNTLGATYVVQNDYEQAMFYFKASSAIAIQLGDKRTLAYNYGSMGEVFLLQGQNDSAMHYFVESKNLILELGGDRGLAVAEHLIGQAYFALNNIPQAEKYFKKALTMHLRDGNTRYQALCYRYLGRINMARNKSDSAEFYLKKGLDVAQSIHSYENMAHIYKAFFDLYKSSQNWEKAIDALQLSKAIEDSMISIANAKEIASLEISYETHKKEQHIKLLSIENQIKSQRMRMAIILISLLIVSVLMGIYVQFMRKQQANLVQNKLRQQLMLSQMNPHFIFNALASIQSYMYKNEPKKAASYLGNFASLSRSILNNSSADSIMLDEEIETLRNYLELEKLRMNGAFTYAIDLVDDIDTEFIAIPPMMLQPFAENAIKHGLKTIDSGGLLSLKFTDKDKYIEVEITDNGIGINAGLQNKNSEHQSRATEIFNQRLKILQKKYRNIPKPMITDLSVENKSGTKVIVYLPIITE